MKYLDPKLNLDPSIYGSKNSDMKLDPCNPCMLQLN